MPAMSWWTVIVPQPNLMTFSRSYHGYPRAKSNLYCFRSKRAQTPRRKGRAKWSTSSANAPQRSTEHMKPPSWRERVMGSSHHLIHRRRCAAVTPAMNYIFRLIRNGFTVLVPRTLRLHPEDLWSGDPIPGKAAMTKLHSGVLLKPDLGGETQPQWTSALGRQV